MRALEIDVLRAILPIAPVNMYDDTRFMENSAFDLQEREMQERERRAGSVGSRRDTESQSICNSAPQRNRDRFAKLHPLPP